VNLSGPDYLAFLTELKGRITSARLNAARAVNRDLILLYWDIGRSIVQRQQTQGWGKAVVEMLSRDLRNAFPQMRGFSANNLWLMRQFYTEYSKPAFLKQAVAELPAEKSRKGRINLEHTVQEAAGDEGKILEHAVQELLTVVPWGHHVEVIKKVKAPGARLYYLRATAQLGWSRKVLLNQIKARAYERSVAGGKTHNFPAVLPEHLAEQAEDTLKSSYNLEFLGIGREVKELELENRLIGRMRDFILELGYGFCFIGRQHRLTIGRKEYFIDLLFYHRFLKALVAVELKVGEFEPEFAGKMDFYLNVLNEKERAPDDNPSIGIILCAEKDDVVVEFSLKTKKNPIGVAEYQLTETLPRELKGKLPTAHELRMALLPESPKSA
jgi:predicted nuclease of restriction endonuclease-like (RecB) superfamily